MTPRRTLTLQSLNVVIPAKAGIHFAFFNPQTGPKCTKITLDSRFRGNDGNIFDPADIFFMSTCLCRTRHQAFFPPNASSKFCLFFKALCQRSPDRVNISITFVIRKSRGWALASSSQVNGIDTGAPGSPLGE